MASSTYISGLPKIEIRSLSLLDEFYACTQLQQEVWGYKDIDVFPQRFFVVIRHVGGQVFGAFDDAGRLIGFLCALVGRKPDGMAFLQSQMLAVRSEFRNFGVARRLKLAQRSDALQRGYSLIEWTFDPLELKNAYFNIEKLGTIVRRYIPNFYGATTSQLQAGLPTDRLVAEWWIKTSHVKNVLGEISAKHTGLRTSEEHLIEIPSSILEWKSKETPAATDFQSKIRREFRSLLEEGLCVTRFQRGREASSYVFTEDISYD